MRRLSLIFLLSFSLSGLTQTQDALLWTGAAVKLDITKDFKFAYETQLRYYKNMSTLSTYYNEVSFEYDVLKGLDLGLSYRYSRKNRESHFAGENRLCLNLSYGYKLDMGLKFSTRMRYQHAFDRVSAINNSIFPDVVQLFRWKTKASYKNDDFKRIQPYATGEWFANLSPSEYGPTNAYRFGVGVDIDLPAKCELSFGYMYEKEFRSTEQNNHIYTIQFTYSIPNRLIDSKG